MSTKCYQETPLKRDGTSQRQRLLKALKDDYVKVDEREITDLIQYARNYAALLKFHATDDPADKWSGNWVPFIENDITTLISMIHLLDVSKIKADFDPLINNMEVAIQGVSTSAKLDAYGAVVDHIFTRSREVDHWLKRSTDGSRLNTEIKRAISPYLRTATERLIAFDKGLDSLYISYSERDFSGLDSFWELGPGKISSITPDTSIFQGTNLSSRLTSAIGPLRRLFLNHWEEQVRLSADALSFLDAALEEDNEHEPHFALFLAFLQIFALLQKELNGLGKKHLDFYYNEVLQLGQNPAQADQVHVIFQLAKNVNQRLVSKETGLKAGKDELGKAIEYTTNDEILVNKGQVESLQSVFLDKHRVVKTQGAELDIVDAVYAAPVANSADGKGAELPPELPIWEGLGEDQSAFPAVSRTMDDGRIGFGIASHIMLLNEGFRELSIKLRFDPVAFNSGFIIPAENEYGFDSNTPAFSPFERNLADAFQFEFTGESGWLKPTHPDDLNLPAGQTAKDQVEIIKSDHAIVFNLYFSPDQEAVICYDTELHGPEFNTPWPMAKALLDTSRFPYLYQLFRELTLREIELAVDVRSMTNLIVQNDDGEVDSSKPFFPFTGQPVVGASFLLGNAEVFSKEITDFKVHLEWLDPPSDMKDHYANYTEQILHNERFTVNLKLLSDFYWKPVSLPVYNTPLPAQYVTSCQAPVGNDINVAGAQLISGGIGGGGGAGGIGGQPEGNDSVGGLEENPEFRVLGIEAEPPVCTVNETHEIYYAEPWGGYSSLGSFSSGIPLFEDPDAKAPRTIEVGETDLAPCNFQRDVGLKSLESYRPGTKRGFIKFELNAPDFQHKAYPFDLTNKIIKLSTKTPTASGHTPNLPRAPYTPEIKSLSLDYTSKLKLNFDSPADPDYYLKQPVEQLFHIYPFGTTEFQPVSNSQFEASNYALPKLTVNTSRLMPTFELSSGLSEGNMFIGIRDLNPGEIITLLFQVREGTGSLDFDPPRIYWSFLSYNNWVDFKQEEVVFERTNGLIRSGIVKLSIPKEATLSHTILADGLIWVRAATTRRSPALPKMVNVHTQAVLATFQDAGNDPNRLANPLSPDTISKLAKRDFLIKETLQPYASFGGRLQEADPQFYKRVSERLRHKGYMINLWDYEHLVLEQFPSIYKCKCLIHTDRQTEVAPGRVMLIVIPDATNSSNIDPIRPKSSLSNLKAIESFVRSRVSVCLANKVEVKNPEYEDIRVEFRVKLKPGFQEDFYLKQLKDELIRHMAPWAYAEGVDIGFGGKVHKSELVNFVEEREYVEYLKDFTMYHIQNGKKSQDLDVIMASNSRAILVASNDHQIFAIQPDGTTSA